MTKNPLMTDAIDDLSESMFGIKRSEALDQAICIKCKEQAIEFKDKISETEYSISAICQTCQDEIFKGDDDGCDAEEDSA